MLKRHKKILILTSLLTLLPIPVGLLLWNRFPEQMVTHWGWNGQPDGWAASPFAVFFPPLFMLLMQWLCIGITVKDPGNQGRNRKPIALVLWIIPALSNLSCYIMYALALGAEFSVERIMFPFMGLMFALIGNYLPKCKTNSTIGIKIPWTYSSEENWNATHRLAGKLWLLCGIVIALCVFLPSGLGIGIMLVSFLVMTAAPMVYSWHFCKQQKARGDALLPMPKISKSAWIALIIVLLFLVCILFTGDLEYEFGDKYLHIKASYYQDMGIDYAGIQSVEYREGTVPGMRVGGYGSFRLLMGYFQNEEFGTHIRYTYYKPESCVVLSWRDKTVVLSGENAAETQKIYQKLLEVTN